MHGAASCCAHSMRGSSCTAVQRLHDLFKAEEHVILFGFIQAGVTPLAGDAPGMLKRQADGEAPLTIIVY